MMADEPKSSVDFSSLKRRRLPAPPSDASENLAAPEIAAPETQVRKVRPYVPAEPPPVPVDGRARLRTGRVEPFSTRVRADFRPRLIAMADHYSVTMGEALEMALAALERETGRGGDG
jgi:hypothetical protein